VRFFATAELVVYKGWQIYRSYILKVFVKISLTVTKIDDFEAENYIL